MPDPVSDYSNLVSNYAKSNSDDDTIKYVLGKNSDTNLGPGISSSTVYSNFYKKEMDPTAYASEFILGHSPAAVNSIILPGDRYSLPVLDKKYDDQGRLITSTNKQCFDASGRSHNLSTIVDNVEKSSVLSDSSNQGLFYSLYASLQDYNNGISNIDLSKNSYLCKPITTYMDDTGRTKSTPVYILKSDTEGFIDSAAFQDVSITSINSEDDRLRSRSSPGSNPGSSNAVNPPILTSNGTPKMDTLGIPMYVNNGEGGGPTQQNVNSQTVKTNQDIMKQLLSSNKGQTMAQTGLANIQSLIASSSKMTPSAKVSAFTTIESSDIIIQQYQNPWEDPIFLFYVGSLGLLFGFLVYRMVNRKSG